jgi:hypothetical protein
VQVHIVRDDRVAPGGEGVVELPGELLFVVSAAGVTQDGAECLQACWRWFIDRGLWRYGQPGGQPLVTRYLHRQRGLDVAQVLCRPGEVECWCSPRHFTRGSVNGLQVAARASVRRGWRYYSSSSTASPARAS